MTKIRFSRTAAVAACALFAFALPANASNTNSNTATRPAAEATQQAGNADQAEDARQRRICVRMQSASGRITRPVCKTAEEWETAGGVPADER